MAKNYALIACVLMITALFSCKSPTAQNEPLSSAALQGTWQDHLDPKVNYYAGSTHKVTFENDSFFLKIYEFTDAYYGGDTCFSLAYTQYMKGQFSFGLQDSVILDGIYVDSLNNPLPVCGCTYGPRQSGTYLASFKGKLEGNTLHVILLSAPYPTEWVLNKE